MIKQIKRKAAAMIFAAVIILMPLWLTGPAMADSGPSDITGHWGEKAIHSAVSQGFVNGYPDGTFRPDDPVTRAEFVTMANTALGLPAENTVVLLFTDVPHNAWYKNEAAKASYARYISGVSDTIFQPDRSITREEAAVIMARILPKAGCLDQSSLSKAPDRGSVSDWALSPMAVMVNKGYINGRDGGNLVPQGSLTRAEAVTLLTAILEKETIIREDVSVKNAGEILANAVYTGDITIEKSVGEGDVTLKNLTALSHVYVLGGGAGTVTIEDSYIVRLAVLKEKTPARVMASGISTIHFSILFNDNLLADSQGETARANKGGYGQIVKVKGTVNEKTGRDITAAIEKQITSTGSITTAQVQAGVKPVLEGAEVSRESTDVIVVDIPQAPAVRPASSGSSGGGGGGGGGSNNTITAAVINGNAKVGEELTAALTPSKATAVYQWQKADTADGTYTDIPDATLSTYLLLAGDLGQYFKVTVTGSGKYTGSVTSDASGPVVTDLTGIGTISGTAKIGETLTAGAVTPEGATAGYQWQSCDTTDGTYTDISGATSNTYQLVENDYQKYIKVTAVGTGNYVGTVTSDAAGPVAAGEITGIGSISGTIKIGETLTAGSVSPAGATVTYQWQICNTAGGTYTDIPDATSDTYQIIADDFGKYFKVTATGTGFYSGTVTSAAAGPAATDLLSIGTISGTVKLGETLTTGSLTPEGATANYQWQRCNTADGTYANISGATSGTYQLAADDYQKYIKVTATGTGSYVGTVTSDAAGPVAPGELTGIGNISGTAKINQTLTAGNVSPAGATFSYQWQRCDTADGTYTDISGATSGTYTCGSGDVGKYLKVAATGTGNYSGTVTSAAKGPIANYTGARFADTFFNYDSEGEYLYTLVTWNDAASITGVFNTTDSVNVAYKANNWSAGTYLYYSDNYFNFDRAYLRGIVNALPSIGSTCTKEYRISFDKGDPVYVTISFRKTKNY